MDVAYEAIQLAVNGQEGNISYSCGNKITQTFFFENLHNLDLNCF